jgi:hypothetical protein
LFFPALSSQRNFRSNGTPCFIFFPSSTSNRQGLVALTVYLPLILAGFKEQAISQAGLLSSCKE